MKKIFFLLLVCCVQVGIAQQHQVGQKIQQELDRKATFIPFSLLTQIEQASDERVSKLVTKATLAKLDTRALQRIFLGKEQTIEVTLPYLEQTLTLQLYKVNPLHEGFHLDTNLEQNIAYQPGVYYRGIIKGDMNSLVAFNFFENDCNAIISSATLGNVVVGKSELNKTSSDYVIYSDADFKISQATACATKDVVTDKPLATSQERLSAKCVSIYFEIENDIYQAGGSNTTTTTNWMTSVFNNVQTIFNNDGISTAIKSIYIWTTPDPYAGSSSTDYLYQFNSVRPAFDGDLGQLVGIDGGLGGVAITVSGLCSSNNFSYSSVNYSYSNFPTYSWTVQVITHELGHLLGSPHTHGCYWNGNNTAIDGCGQSAGYSEGSCPQGPIPSSAVKGTIMSYCHLVSGVGISFSNGFGPQPTNRILTAIGNGTCLSTDCVNTCVNNITAAAVNSVNDTSATITWSELGGTTLAQVSVFPFGSSPGSWITPNANSYTATGLSPNTYYKAIVRNSCGNGLEAPSKVLVFATTGDFCSGIPVTDSGGTSGNYTDNETVTRVIIPSNPFAKAKLTFSSFDLELNYDYLHVYDGSNDTYPELSGANGFTGNSLPAPVESTASDGALTLKFISDGGVVGAGYVATVSCLTLGTTPFSAGLDFSYSPNPVNDVLTITAGKELSDISIYSVQGQLLKQIKNGTPVTKINMVDFAAGTYFFKVTSGTTLGYFKILKM